MAGEFGDNPARTRADRHGHRFLYKEYTFHIYSERAIAEHVARLIPDQATIKLGVGSIPEAVTHALGGKRGLGVHSAAIGDGIADLMEAGIVDNRHKEIDPGITVATILMGTRRLYRFADRNPSIRIRATSYTYDALVLGNFRHFVANNGALEVDLTGQVNAETAAGRHIGLVGGQMDFERRQSRAGRAVDHRAAIDQPRSHPLVHRRQAGRWRSLHPARRGRCCGHRIRHSRAARPHPGRTHPR